MNLYDELFGNLLEPPQIIVDIFAERTGGFMAEDIGDGKAIYPCQGYGQVGWRVLINYNGDILQRLEKLEEVEIEL